MKMSVLILLVSLFSVTSAIASKIEEITPYKFTDEEYEKNELSIYSIPESSRFTTMRSDEDASDIVYYLSKAQTKTYPIAILCTGSSTKETISSIIHIHRYFLQNFMDLGAGVLTVEQWGIDGNKIQEKEFLDHYTRSQRLQDHQDIVERLKSSPPVGWNGKLIFWGASEGGGLVTKLTEKYSDITLATMNWSGAGDWSWGEELWAFCQKLNKDPNSNDCRTDWKDIASKEHYEERLDAIKKNPTSELDFFSMTYKYHKDALLWPKPDYKKIRTPFLVVAGTQDTIIESSDAFVEKAQNAKVPLTYLRVEMDHYVRKRPDIIKKSFEWLDQILHPL
jgi:hypothetical protein